MEKINNLSKRQQITASNKTVFLYVAVGSIIVAFSLMAVFFFGRQLLFQNQVLGEKQTTRDNLRANLDISKELTKNVNELLADPALNSAKSASDANNLQVVFDALPTSYDGPNFGASLQGVLLNGTVATIESLTVDSAPEGIADDPTLVTPVDGVKGPQPITFTLTITGSADQIRTALSNMEKSIRPIKVVTLTIDGGTPLTARITGETYFDPSVDLKLTDKTVKPKGIL